MSQRRVLFEKLSALLENYREKGSVYLFSVDFDNFKMVNYHYGFEQGDALLQEAARSIRSLPDCIFCERAASDQFLFLIFSTRLWSDDEILSYYSYYSEKFLVEQRKLYPACSLKLWCGIYEIKDNNIAAAIDNANLARFEAKRTNSPTAVLVRKSRLDELAEDHRREKEIMQALSEGRFSFYLQPQVNLKTGEIVGAEALAREYDADGNPVYPDSFIPVLEQNGGIVQLDYLVLEKVCADLRYRLDNGEPVVRTAVNLSRQHIWNPETADCLHAIVSKYRVPTGLIVFELTESILVSEFSGAQVLGSTLHSFGYKTSIDDFGSGYAGINIWQHLTFDELKLDRQFLSSDPVLHTRNQAIIWGIVAIANKLGIDVICEGMEYAQQCRELLDLGCLYGQGYYFSKPLPPDDFYKMYQAGSGRCPIPQHRKGNSAPPPSEMGGE